MNKYRVKLTITVDVVVEAKNPMGARHWGKRFETKIEQLAKEEAKKLKKSRIESLTVEDADDNT